MAKTFDTYKIWNVYDDIDLRSVRWADEYLVTLAGKLPPGFALVFFNPGRKKRRDIINNGRTLAVVCHRTGGHSVSEEVVDDYVRSTAESPAVLKHQSKVAKELETRKLKRDQREKRLREMHEQKNHGKRPKAA